MPYTPTSRSPSGYTPDDMAFSARTDNDYHTAMSGSSFDPQNEALNSTAAFDHSQGSADMSVEVGRGVKRRAREDELSEDGIYTFGSDQQYELTHTPPMRPQRFSSTRKNESGLQREASMRKASEMNKANGSAKRTTSTGTKRQSDLIEALRQDGNNSLHGDDTLQRNITLPTRSTRFTATRKAPGGHPARVLSGSTLEGSREDPKEPASSHKNATTHSTQSFLIPDIDGATALFGGTPAVPRVGKRSSRFTPSAAYKMPPRPSVTEHFTLNEVPVPDDAKRVYQGLQEALERISNLELEKEEQLNQQEDLEAVITNLRTELAIERQAHRPDSGLGSEEEGSGEKWRREKAQLQSQVKTLQSRATKAERQATLHEVTVKRVTAERAEIYSQAEAAISELEETKAENEQFREAFPKLQEENEELREEISLLQKENEGLGALVTRSKKGVKEVPLPTKEFEDLTLELQAKKEKRQSTHPLKPQEVEESVVVDETKNYERRFSFGELDEKARDSIVHTVQQELQRIQRKASEKARATVTDRSLQTGAAKSRHSSTATQLHHQLSSIRDRRPSATSTSRRAASAPVESSASEADSDNEPSITARTRTTLRDLNLPSPATKPRSVKENTADLTQLSNGTLSTGGLRKALEEQRRPNHPKRHSSAPVAEGETRVQDAGQTPFRRKSSMKDLATDLTGKLSLTGDASVRLPKTVRVQSPHTSDATAAGGVEEDQDVSVYSTASTRRRARAPSEGETSGFILPDITFRAAIPSPHGASDHHRAACSLCNPSSTSDGKDIPFPIPVSTRSDLGEDATLRPAWPPHLALALVVQQMRDELVHLTVQLQGKQNEYAGLDFSCGRRRRLELAEWVRKLEVEVERKAEMVYRVHDVVEGFREKYTDGAGKEAGPAEEGRRNMSEETQREVEETLQSLGMDPVELAGRMGRSVPEGLREEFDGGEESGELPWEGLSESSEED